MRAIGFHQFGGNEVLKMLEVPVPEVGAEEVRIRVHAAGVNPVDWKTRSGGLQTRMPHQFPVILGWDAAGVVDAVGSDVLGLHEGDAVYAYCRRSHIQWGSFAEYIVLPADQVSLKPKNLSFEEAASIPLAALTAYQSLFDAAHLSAGERVLIHAAAGGVGGFAVQLARYYGAHVIGTASAENHDYVREIGCTEVIDYRASDFVTTVRERYPEGIDVVFDTVGGENQLRSAQVLREHGRLVTILAYHDEAALRKLPVDLHYVFVSPDKEQLVRLAELAEKGELKTTLAAVLPLEDAPKALDLIAMGHTRGKIVLRVRA